MKYIQIGGHYKNGKIRGYAKVDDEDYKRLSKYKWGKSTHGYARRCERGGGKSGKQICYMMHREVINVPKNRYIDHIDGDPFNNQKSNLRVVKHYENARNVKINRLNNTSGYKGVSKYPGGWRAYIVVNYRQKHLGVFDTPLEAAKAYNASAIEIHGKFARLNDI